VSANVARIAKEVQEAMPLPASLHELDAQARRQVDVAARWHQTDPETYYRAAVEQRRNVAASDSRTDAVVDAILSRP